MDWSIPEFLTEAEVQRHLRLGDIEAAEDRLLLAQLVTAAKQYVEKDCRIVIDSEAPALLKQAVLMLVGHWHANREATSDRRVNEVPLAVRNILDLHRQWEAV